MAILNRHDMPVVAMLAAGDLSHVAFDPRSPEVPDGDQSKDAQREAEDLPKRHL